MHVFRNAWKNTILAQIGCVDTKELFLGKNYGTFGIRGIKEEQNYNRDEIKVFAEECRNMFTNSKERCSIQSCILFKTNCLFACLLMLGVELVKPLY